MSIPFTDKLHWDSYRAIPNWYENQTARAPLIDGGAVGPAIYELFAQTFKQPLIRGIQFFRDAARLVLKVPVRSTWTPIILEKNWKQRERAKINIKLASYAFVQLIAVSAKILVALAAFVVSTASLEKAKWLLDKSECWTTNVDGRTSQLEALKEVGLKNALDRDQFNEYKNWLYRIDPKLCRKEN